MILRLINMFRSVIISYLKRFYYYFKVKKIKEELKELKEENREISKKSDAAFDDFMSQYAKYKSSKRSDVADPKEGDGNGSET